jgi:RNA-directed DNA polymerase
MSGPDAKPFGIPKRLVWQAWKQVKANGGAAGADGQSIEDFGKDLKDNLYKVWNRMSSGTYFPPPGAGRGDTQGGGRHPDARRAHRR